jgi:hypothetical protein
MLATPVRGCQEGSDEVGIFSHFVDVLTVGKSNVGVGAQRQKNTTQAASLRDAVAWSRSMKTRRKKSLIQPKKWHIFEEKKSHLFQSHDLCHEKSRRKRVKMSTIVLVYLYGRANKLPKAEKWINIYLLTYAVPVT